MLEEATTGSNLARKATLLMAEVLQIANRVLPLSVAAKLQVSVLSLLHAFNIDPVSLDYSSCFQPRL